MNQLEKFWESVKQEDSALFATSANESVTMRTISPVYHDGAILMFTAPTSLKYQQLKENPNCCVAVGGYFLEASAEFFGATMLDKNTVLRDVYSKKFSDAFSDSVEHGGRDAEFLLLKPKRVKGWVFENGAPTEPFEHTF
jgi:uncharacterized pyridoxamine 5'-phosphate oxidase family protein